MYALDDCVARNLDISQQDSELATNESRPLSFVKPYDHSDVYSSRRGRITPQTSHVACGCQATHPPAPTQAPNPRRATAHDDCLTEGGEGWSHAVHTAPPIQHVL